MLPSTRVVCLLFVVLLSVQGEEQKKPAKPACSGKNTEWRECTNVCGEKHCGNYMQVAGCFSLRCGPAACVCKEGHVFLNIENKDQGCVPRETCRKLDNLRTAERNLNNLKASKPV